MGSGGSWLVLELVPALIIPLLGALGLAWGKAGSCDRAGASVLVEESFLNSVGGRWGSRGPWIEHSDWISAFRAGFRVPIHGGFGAVEAGVDVGAVPEAHPGVGAHGGVRQQGAPRLPGRPPLARRVPGLRHLLAPRARRAAAMARVYRARGAGGGQPRPRRRLRHPLELLRLHDLAGVRTLRAS